MQSPSPGTTPVNGLLHIVIFVAVVCLIVGCSSSRGRRPDAVSRPPPQPTLWGKATWFDGAVHTQVVVNAAPRPNGQRPTDGEPTDSGERRGRRSGGERPEGGARAGAGSAGPRQGSMTVLNSPRQVLNVEVTNLTDAKLTVQPQECTSVLGSFAVRPETLTLDPGESGMLDPMRGGNGASFDRLEVTLVLASAGKVEKQVVVAERASPNIDEP